MTTVPLTQCVACSHRRPPLPLVGWRLVRRIAWVALWAWTGVTLLFGLVGWAAVITILVGG